MSAAPHSPPAEIISICPATLEELGRVPVCQENDVQAALLRARSAQREWAALSFKERARVIKKARMLLVDRQDEISKLISRETGKPAMEALGGEVMPIANLMEYFGRRAAKMLRPERFSLSVFRNKHSTVRFEPLGVVGIISPWNFPFSIPMGAVVMALLAGNAVLLKPSEHTPLTALWAGQLFKDAGLPAGLLEILTGDGITGAALAGAAIDKLVFTGSVATGRKLAEAAARRFLPIVLELGGKDPMIVCADAPLERTANGAVWGAFFNCGQACASVERVYVVKAVAESFLGSVVEKTKALRAGADVGPMISERQLQIVLDHIADAVARGAQLLTGGRRIAGRAGYFLEPAVLANVDHTMRIMQEETFGPVLPVMVVDDEETAIEAANDSRFGLLASVWSRNPRRARDIAGKIEAGTVIINDSIYTHGACETPWFGIKDSGMGVSHSHHGLREFVRMKHINVDRLPLKTNLWWFPYTEEKYRGFKKLTRILHKWGLKRWM